MTAFSNAIVIVSIILGAPILMKYLDWNPQVAEHPWTPVIGGGGLGTLFAAWLIANGVLP